MSERAIGRTPIQVFEDNMADAERLIALTRILLNTRTRRMRAEMRQRVGDAIRVRQRDRTELDCVESDDVFVVLKPGGRARREHFTEPELRPLLRQAVVAIAAAVESYVAEKACCYIREALDERGRRLLDIPTTVEYVLELETYERRGWGHRRLVREYLEREASASPNKIGLVFATVGKTGFWKKVDTKRGVSRGSSEKQLEALADRRNRIAHTGDRQGRGRAHLELAHVEEHFVNARDIVEALESVL
jgi:hypothetical protein